MTKFTLLCLLGATISPLLAMEMQVFNVGQGNCTVVRHPTEAHLLIDAGSAKVPYHTKPANIKKAIVTYILAGKPSRVIIVVSHSHKDHYGWIPAVATKLTAKNITISLLLGGTESDYQTAAHKKLNKLKEQVGGSCVSDYPIDTLKRLNQLLPSYCTVRAACTTGSACNPNCRSIVLFIHGLEGIVPGDATGVTSDAIEKSKLPMKAAFLIVPHHGSNTEESNNQTFLDSISPDCALISCSDRYNHPEGPVIERLVGALKGKRVKPHTLTYHPGSELLEENDYLRHFLTYNHGYRTAVTDLPIYTTADMGDIRIQRQPDSTLLLSFPNEATRSLNPNYCIVKSIQNPPLEGLTCIDLPRSCVGDADLRTLRSLPGTVTTFNLDKNQLTPETIMHIFRILSKHSVPIKIGVKEVGFSVGHFEWIVRNDPVVGPLLRKWLFFCIMTPEGEPNTGRLLDRIDFSIGSDNPGAGIFVPAYVVPHEIRRDCYVLQHYFENTSYSNDLRKLE